MPVRAVLTAREVPGFAPPSRARYAGMLASGAPALDWPIVILNPTEAHTNWIAWAPPWLASIPASHVLEARSPERVFALPANLRARFGDVECALGMVAAATLWTDALDGRLGV